MLRAYQRPYRRGHGTVGITVEHGPPRPVRVLDTRVVRDSTHTRQTGALRDTLRVVRALSNDAGVGSATTRKVSA